MSRASLVFALLAVAAVLGAVDAQSFPQARALRFVYNSYAAYCPEAAIRAWKCQFCKAPVPKFVVTDTFYDQQTNSFGYAGYNPDANEITLVFRGTEMGSIKNWIQDLKFWKANVTFDGLPGGVLVASGFNQCWAALRAQVVPAVKRLLARYPSAPLWITGHSLGGAIATLAALDLQLTAGTGTVRVLTFGSPRVGDPQFAQAYSRYVNETWRIVNNRDLVPHLPFMNLNFNHPTIEVWEKDNVYQTCSRTNGEDPNCSDSLTIAISIPDHLSYMQVSYWSCPSLAATTDVDVAAERAAFQASIAAQQAALEADSELAAGLAADQRLLQKQPTVPGVTATA